MIDRTHDLPISRQAKVLNVSRGKPSFIPPTSRTAAAGFCCWRRCLAGSRISKNCSPTGAYQGPIFAEAVAKILSRIKVEIVKRSDQAKGFVTLPKRWIVERTIAWLNRSRRLAKDWGNLNVTALMFLRFASIRLMLRKLCNPA